MCSARARQPPPQQQQLLLPAPVRCVRLGPDRARQLVAYGSDDGVARVYVFDAYAPAAQLTLPRARDGVTAIAFDATQRTTLVGSEAGDVCVCDVATERVVHVFGKRHARVVTAVDVLHGTYSSGSTSSGGGGHCYAASVSSDGQLRLWDVRARTRVQLYRQPQPHAASRGTSVTAAAAVTSGGGESDGAPLYAVCFAPSGAWLATGNALGVVRLYDLVAGKLAYTLAQEEQQQQRELCCHRDAITCVRFHGEMALLAVGSRDGVVSVWSLRDGEPVRQSAFVARDGGSTNNNVEALCMCGHELVVATRHGVYTHSLRRGDATASAAVVRLCDAPVATAAPASSSSSSSSRSTMTDMVYSSYDEAVWMAGCCATSTYTARLPLRPRDVRSGHDGVAAAAAASGLSLPPCVDAGRHTSVLTHENGNDHDSTPATTTAAAAHDAAVTATMQLLMPFAHDGAPDDADAAYLVDDGAAVLALLRARATCVRQLLRLWQQHGASDALAAAVAAAREDEEGEHAVCDFLVAVTALQQRAGDNNSNNKRACGVAVAAEQLADVLDTLCALSEERTRHAALRHAALSLLGCILQQQQQQHHLQRHEGEEEAKRANDDDDDDAAAAVVTAAIVSTCAQRLHALTTQSGALGEHARTLLATLSSPRQ